VSFFIFALLLLTACGRRKVQVSAPQPVAGSSAASFAELEGLASYYAEPYHGRKTASGEVFDSYQQMTAAHRTLPFNTLVRVTNKTNGREVEVRINDRGPFIEGRVIDLSLLAAREIDLVRPGIVPVKLTILKTADLQKTSFAPQVGAFENRKTAEELKRRLEKKYRDVVIQTVAEDKTLHRVRIRQPSQEAANKVAAELRKDDFKPLIVRTN
jgi:rare lipoprotein A